MKHFFPRRRRAGQSMIEFLFVSVLFMTMLMVSYNAVIAFSLQQYLSWAGFLAARAFQASNSDPGAQRAAAQKVLTDFGVYPPGGPLTIESFGSRPLGTVKDVVIVSKGAATPPDIGSYALLEGGGVTSAGAQSNVFGIEVEYNLLGNVPFFSAGGAAVSTITLRSKSYLGREPSKGECVSFFQSFFGKYTIGGPASDARYMEDNGC